MATIGEAFQQPNGYARIEAQQRALGRIWAEVVRPALMRNYLASGIRTGQAVLFQALTVPGAKGNVHRVSTNELEFGVDPGAVRYFQWVIQGRGPVQAKRAKFLRFYLPSARKVVYRKRVGPAPAHDVVFLKPEDVARANEIAAEEIGGLVVRQR